MARGTSSLVGALGALTSTPPPKALRVDVLLGHDPEALDAIRDACRRGISIRRIADEIRKATGEVLSENALDSWLKREGLR